MTAQTRVRTGLAARYKNHLSHISDQSCDGKQAKSERIWTKYKICVVGNVRHPFYLKKVVVKNLHPAT
jgi:hypothetical protein